MDDFRTLRRKAARFFESAASATTTDEAEKLREVGRQLELWADDLEEMLTPAGAEASKLRMKRGRADHKIPAMRADARTRS